MVYVQPLDDVLSSRRELRLVPCETLFLDTRPLSFVINQVQDQYEVAGVWSKVLKEKNTFRSKYCLYF